MRCDAAWCVATAGAAETAEGRVIAPAEPIATKAAADAAVRLNSFLDIVPYLPLVVEDHSPVRWPACGAPDRGGGDVAYGLSHAKRAVPVATRVG